MGGITIMKKSGFIKSFIVVVATLFFSASAWSQEIKHLSTGIGYSERQAPYSDYSTKIVLFVTGGAFLANVNVTVLDMKDKVLFQGVSQGPWFLINLEPGEYQVIAKRKSGETQSARFTVKSGQQTRVPLLFPQKLPAYDQQLKSKKV